MDTTRRRLRQRRQAAMAAARWMWMPSSMDYRCRRRCQRRPSAMPSMIVQQQQEQSIPQTTELLLGQL